MGSLKTRERIHTGEKHCVSSVLAKQFIQGIVKELTLGKSPINVNIVANLLVKQEALRFMNEFTLGKSLMNVNSVASVLANQET